MPRKPSFKDDEYSKAEATVKAIVLGGGNIESRQLTTDEKQFASMGEDIVKPPIDLRFWAAALEINTRLGRAVRTYARNTVGLGWDVTPWSDVEVILNAKDDDLSEEERQQRDELQKAYDADKAKLEKLFDKPNADMPFTKVMELVKIDEEATGNGYLEVARNAAGEVGGLYHVPSHTIRILKSGDGFIQIRGGKKRYFKKFGDKRIIDNRTGKIFQAEKPGQFLPVKFRASELIQFMIYSPRSSYYGVPRHVATAPAIAGSRLAAERNAVFFENDCVPRVAITVTGGRLTPESLDQLKKFFEQQGKGVKNAHRVMILQPQRKQMGVTKSDDVQIKIDKMTVGETDDASFQKYREMNDEEVREAFGLDKSFFNTDGINKAGAVVGRSITIEQEFNPDAIDKEYTLNHTLVAGMGITNARLQFRRPRQTTEEGDVGAFEKLTKSGGITPNDVRKLLTSLGFEGFEAFDTEWANKPLQIALLEMQQGMIAEANGQAQNSSVNNMGQRLVDDLMKLNDAVNTLVEKGDAKQLLKLNLTGTNGHQDK